MPWSDEGEFSSAAFNLAHHGFMGTTVLESEGNGLTRIGQHTYWVMPLYLVAQALWYKVFSASILSTRAFSLLIWGMLMILFFHLFLSKLKLAPDVSSLGASLLATSFVFIDNAAFARPDVMCCALGLGGIATYLCWREEHLYRALFAANALIAAAGLTHPNGVFHFLALAAIVLWFDRRRLDWAAVAAAASPYLIEGAIFGLYIAKDPTAFHDQLLTNSLNGRLPRSFGPMSILKSELMRYATTFGLITRGVALGKAYALAAYVAALAGCLLTPSLRQEPSVRLLLVLLAVYFLAMSLFNQKLSYYLIHILPFYIALLAIWIRWLWDSRPRLRAPVAAAVAILILIETSGIVVKAIKDRYQIQQRPAVAFILDHARPDDKIYGSAALIYGLNFDPRLRDDPFLGLRGGQAPNIVVIETLYRLQYEAWAAERPADMRRIRQRLSQYELGYHEGGYEVYLLSDSTLH